MPDKPEVSSNKKARLGRGLGSLLGGASNLDEPATPVPPAGATSAGPAKVQTDSQTKTAATQATAVRAPAADAEQAKPAPTPPPINEEAQIWMIPIDRLTPNTQQPRQIFSAEALKELTASIKAKGILQPITARRLSERQFEIIAGERRWRAAQAAGLHQVPVILKKISQQDSLELAIIENIQRENLNPLEEAEAFDMLLRDYSLTQQQVADQLGKERSTIANSLRLLALPPEIKIMLRKNELSAGHAKVLLGLENNEQQLELAKQIIADRLSVRAAEKLVAKVKSDTREAATKPSGSINVDVPKRLIEGLSSELQKLIGTKVSIDYADGKGKLSVHFYADDHLTQIVEKMRSAWEK